MEKLQQKALYYFRRLLRFGRTEPLLVLAAIACYAAFAFFGGLVDDVFEGESRAIDEYLLLLLRDPGDTQSPLGPHWVEEMMRDMTGMGGIIILTLITLVAALYLFIRRMRGQALYLLCAVATGIALSNTLKHSFDRPRPDLVPHGSFTLSPSFPSGHALMAAVVYLTLGAIMAENHPQHRLKLYFIGLAIGVTVLVGVSRVYLGVHWPSDVLAGWLVGSGWALLFWMGDRYLKIRGRLKGSGS